MSFIENKKTWWSNSIIIVIKPTWLKWLFAMFDGLFLLTCHCTRSIFFPFNILAGLRIKSCVSPYSLDDGIFLVFLNRHKHRICRTHTIVHATIKISRSWQDSMISLSVFSVLLPLVEEQDLSDDISGTFNRPPYRYPSLTHSKRNGSIRLVKSLGGTLQWLNPRLSVIYIRTILESHITIRDGKCKQIDNEAIQTCHVTDQRKLKGDLFPPRALFVHEFL